MKIITDHKPIIYLSSKKIESKVKIFWNELSDHFHTLAQIGLYKCKRKKLKKYFKLIDPEQS